MLQERELIGVGVACALALAWSVSADTITVPGDQPSIQAAIDAAADGDEIVVAPGVYEEALDLKAKIVVIRSTDGAAVTTIDASDLDASAVAIQSIPFEGVRLEGFTITGGDTILGGGLRIEGASPVIVDCIIEGNTADLGGGVYCEVASPRFDGCRIAGNSAVSGGGLANAEGSPALIDCVVIDNEAIENGGGVLSDTPAGRLVNSVNTLFLGNVAGGDGGAIYTRGGIVGNDDLAVNCVFNGNSADRGGAVFSKTLGHIFISNSTAIGNSSATGGALCVQADHPLFPATISIDNSILWGNDATSGSQIALIAGDGFDGLTTINVGSSNVEGGEAKIDAFPDSILNWGDGNIDADPVFVDADGDDDTAGTEDDNFRLTVESPCVDGGLAGAIAPDTFDLDDDGDTVEPIPFDADGNDRVQLLVDQGAFERAIPMLAAADADETADGTAAGDRFGHSVAGIGDVDNDGADDYIVGAYLKTVGGQAQRGRVYVYSGATGGLLWSEKGAAAGDQFGFAVAPAGDTNGDGVPDVIVGARRYDDGNESNNGRAYLYSGNDGSLLWTFTGGATNDQAGTALDRIGDVNGDGFSDVVISAPKKLSNTGRVYVVSGADGSILFAATGSAGGGFFGWSVTGLDDLNGDNIPDFAAGAYRDPTNGINSGAAFVLSGADGSTIYTLDDSLDGDELGFSIDSAGDVDNDGVGDVVVGARLADFDNLADNGAAYVYSGATGDMIRVFTGEAAGDRLGTSVAGLGDITGDEHGDLVLGSPNHDGAGRIRIVSGATGNPLVVFDGEAAGDEFGYSVARAGDVNDDNATDILIGARRHDGNGVDSGRIYIIYNEPVGPPPIVGDLDGNGVVDGADLGLLLGAWGPCAGCDADLNGDDTVDGADLGLLLGNWSV